MIPDLQACAASPAEFRKRLIVPSGRGLIQFGAALADFQRKDFQALDPAFVSLRDGSKPDCGRFWIERTKGASKDSDLSTLIIWLLAFGSRALWCQVGAADQSQADELRKAAKGILQQNPWLAQFVEAQASSLVNRRTGSECAIIPADVSGSHGARPDLLVLNELAHITKKEFAENLMDNAEKVPHGVVIVATNAGFLDSWAHAWRQNAKTAERWYFSSYDQPAPWLDVKAIEDARSRNTPMRFARLWQGSWVPQTEEGVFREEDIQAMLDDSVLPLSHGASKDSRYVVGMDVGQATAPTTACVFEIKLPKPLAQARDLPVNDWRSNKPEVCRPPEPDISDIEYRPTFNCRDLRRWPLKTSYQVIASEAGKLLSRLPAGSILCVDATGVGGHLVDYLQRALARMGIKGYLASVFVTGGQATTQAGEGVWRVSKVDLVSGFQTALSNNRVRVARSLTETPTLVRELRRFRMKVSAAGNELFDTTAGKEGHGDLAFAAFLAQFGAGLGWRPPDTGPHRLVA